MSIETLTAQILPNIIGGARVESASDRSLPVLNPSTGETLATVPLSQSSDLDAAVNAAADAQREWSALPLKDRVQVLYRFKTRIEEELDHLAEIITLENGKTDAES